MYAVTEEQGKVLNASLSDLLVLSEAQAVFLTDSGGNLIAHNAAEDVDDTIYNIAALAAGSFSATRELAALIKEPSFQCIFHQGERTSIYMQSMGGDFLILVIFSKATTAGLVKLYADRTAKELQPVLERLNDSIGGASTGSMARRFEFKQGEEVFRKKPK